CIPPGPTGLRSCCIPPGPTGLRSCCIPPGPTGLRSSLIAPGRLPTLSGLKWEVLKCCCPSVAIHKPRRRNAAIILDAI
ncbi:hypothetical protein QKW61_015165, partial [Staphylococcus nepalensis]|nr:hypothetical protein [Staphylococcus nepalensis]